MASFFKDLNNKRVKINTSYNTKDIFIIYERIVV